MTGLAEIEDLHVPRWYGFPKGTVVTLSLQRRQRRRLRSLGVLPRPGPWHGLRCSKGQGHRQEAIDSAQRVAGTRRQLSSGKDNPQGEGRSCRRRQGSLLGRQHRRLLLGEERQGALRAVRGQPTRRSPRHVRWVEAVPAGDPLRKHKAEPGGPAARPRTVDDFKAYFRFWIEGPDFLTGGEELWPAGPEVPEKEQDLELRKMFIVNATVTGDAVDLWNQFFSFNRPGHSWWSFVLFITIWQKAWLYCSL